LIYDSFFGFVSEPFGVTPNPDFLFLSRAHEDALAHLRFGIAEDRGFIMLTGEIGSGKTTLMRYFIEGLEESVHASVILNPRAEPPELLKLIVRDFGIACSDNTLAGLMECLNGFLVRSCEKKEKAVIIIDEAQDMSAESLEFVRLLSNIETDTRKLLQLVLIGQPELRDLVAGEGLRQLDQRISVRYHIGPLGKDEVSAYIIHRLSKAGSDLIFPRWGMDMLYRYSRGIPRLINRACDRILLFAYAEGRHDIDTKVIRQALKELGIKSRKPELYALAAILIAVIVLLTAGIVRKDRAFISPPGGRQEQIKETKSPAGRFSAGNDGMVYATNPSDAKEAALFSLLSWWGETEVIGAGTAAKAAALKGYSHYSYRLDWEKIQRLNMPAVLRLKENRAERWAALLWIIGKDAVLFDPLKGWQIESKEKIGKSADGFVMFWKNKYNTADKIALLQNALTSRGLLGQHRHGKLDDETGRALRRFQNNSNIPASGRLDEETLVLLSKNRTTPEIYPQKIKRGGFYGHQGTEQGNQDK
jgi:general secretion pathway protein A